MITQEQKDSFASNGYLIVPGILNHEQVRSLRDYLRPKFMTAPEHRPKGDTDSCTFNVFTRNPAIRWLLNHEPTRQVLRGLLGDDFVVLRETSAHFEGFGGWHKDTRAQERAGHMFHLEPDYLMVELAYYLQDNSSEFGGGLDVRAGSHRERDRFAAPKKNNLSSKIRDRVFGAPEEGKNSISVPSKAGDIVIFDFRIDHQATQRTSSNPPPDRQKMAIFIACSRNTPQVQRYHDYIGSRADYHYLHDGILYPEDFARDAKAHGINMP